jgi:peroxiredoxin
MWISQILLRSGMLLTALVTVGAIVRSADVPRPVPSATFRTADGGMIDLAKYRGKVVVLEFLLTTCGHCQQCSVVLQQLQQQYGPKGFQVIGVATNEMAQMLVNDFKKQHGLTFPVGFTDYKTSVEWLQHPVMLNMYMPQLAVIDRNGTIRHQYGGTDKWCPEAKDSKMRADIEALLKEPATAGQSKSPAKKATTRKSS